MGNDTTGTHTRWYRIHSGGVVEEITEARTDWFEATIITVNGRRHLVGRAPTFDVAEILNCRHLHSIEHRRCSGACQFEWTVEQIPASVLAAG
jgi:hypothetical protein